MITTRHAATRNPLSETDAARLLADVQDVGLRDHAWSGITRTESLAHGEMWKDLLTRAPEGTEAPAASLAAFSFWINGDGMSARASLERIPEGQNYRRVRGWCPSGRGRHGYGRPRHRDRAARRAEQ